MPEAIIKVGMDHAGVRAGAAEVKAQLRDLKHHSEAAGHGGAHTHGHKIGSMMGELKVEKNVSKLSTELLTARSGAEALAVGLERVGKILHLGIGLGVAAHLAGWFIEQNEKLIEQFEKLNESAEAFGETSKNAADSGSFEQNLAALKDGAKQLAEIKKGVDANHSGIATMWQLATLGLNGYARRERELQAQKNKFTADQGIAENAEAALEELRINSEIQQLKAGGREREAEALENERKEKLEISRIERSALSPEKKKEAIELVKAAHEAIGSAKELAEERAAQAEIQKEINDLDHQQSDTLGEIARLGETEEARMSRLVDETGRLAKENAFIEELERKGMAHDSDRLAYRRNALKMAKDMKDLADQAHKSQEKNESEVEQRRKEKQKDEERLAELKTQNAEKQFKNSLDGMSDGEKNAALLLKRDAAAKEYYAESKAGHAISAEEAKGKVLDLNKELDALTNKKKKPHIYAEGQTAFGAGYAAYVAPDKDLAKKTVDLLTDIRDKVGKTQWTR